MWGRLAEVVEPSDHSRIISPPPCRHLTIFPLDIIAALP
jgi:hypothetical protein